MSTNPEVEYEKQMQEMQEILQRQQQRERVLIQRVAQLEQEVACAMLENEILRERTLLAAEAVATQRASIGATADLDKANGKRLIKLEDIVNRAISSASRWIAHPDWYGYDAKGGLRDVLAILQDNSTPSTPQ